MGGEFPQNNPSGGSPQAAEARRRQEEARGAELGRRRSLAGLQHDALRRQRDFERKVGGFLGWGAPPNYPP